MTVLKQQSKGYKVSDIYAMNSFPFPEHKNHSKLFLMFEICCPKIMLHFGRWNEKKTHSSLTIIKFHKNITIINNDKNPEEQLQSNVCQTSSTGVSQPFY